MASGLPVITSRFNGVSELMTQGIEGHVLQDPSDCHEFVRCLRHLMDSHARQAMARAARRLAELHPLDANFEQIVQLYEEVVERKEGGAMQSEKNLSWQQQLARAGC
jgi:UDP-glucose:(heptosyl)LPS alpha-1,3-glucosyltransferase